jgi:glycosyltransferase involved in cell wall biosynthesis
MIVKDEGKRLDSFLKKIKPYADEIIIVDTGSSDATKVIALAHTPFVSDFKWVDDFSAARNFSISKAKCDWVLWLDPDEEISSEDLKKMKELCEDKKNLGYRFIQETIINGKKYVQGICKLFQNHKGIKFIYPVHESVMPSIKEQGGTIGKTGIVIKHKSFYDLKKVKSYMRLIEKKAKKWPESSADKEIEFMREVSETFLNTP